MEPVYMWLVFGVVMMIIEIFTPGFFAGSIGIAAFITSLSALVIPNNDVVQWVTFFITNFIMFAFIRKLAIRFLYKDKKKIESNFNAVIGQVTPVLENIDNESGTGYIKIYGDMWRAVAENGKIIKKGVKVKILRTEGNKVFVTVIDE